jgi:hypothetical protein
MQEKLLQFIWQYSLYCPAGLATTRGEPLQILHGGTLNTNSGPDFSSARIKLGATTMAGHIELHVHTSDWIRHNHSKNDAYRNLVLHVVYEHDLTEEPSDIPVLELKPYIPAYVLAQYSSLLQTTAVLPCAAQLKSVKSITRESWLNRLLVERWQQKLEGWQEELVQAGNDWRTLLYWRMAANFGFKVNSVPFLLLAQSLPMQLLGKQHALRQIEALIFGQAGLLEGIFADDYPSGLQQEYRYLQHKFRLKPIAGYLWKFLRMRPANFPTIRLAQFAALVHQSLHLFTSLGDRSNVVEITKLLTVQASPYWDDHYRFDERQKNKSVKKLGRDSVENIIVNTIAPIRFLYAYTQGLEAEKEEALILLEQLPAENNNILRLWSEHGWKAINAGQSQSLLQLYNHYCTHKRCLECAIGLSIIKSGPDK